ncbi:hypothetical protein RIF29_40424 [Crotalaria pallida]|uniref:Pentatricopeptide repeat-containing protein n=1 Tax=Crotalaria pallida TaxID=3830 RepID=A0AAN9E5I8_CROPI
MQQRLDCDTLVLFDQLGLFGPLTLDQSTEPDLVVSWSALISGYVQNGLGKEALLAFGDMCLLGVKCNEFTFRCVFKACSVKKDLNMGKKVHGMTLE